MPTLSLPRVGLNAPRSFDDPLMPAERDTLLRTIARPAVGGLAAVGNILDLPGSTVRDVLALKNPLDQWLPWNWTSSENRTSGRDLLRQYGVAGSRDTWGNFGGGLAAEIALDPLTYLTLGGAALTKAGQAAKRANLLDDAARAAYRQGIGPRQFRQSKTLRDVMDFHGPIGTASRRDAMQRAMQSAKGMDTNLASILDEPLGGGVGFRVPFTDIHGAFKAGPRSQALGRALDTAGRAVRGSGPVRLASRLFEKSSMGAATHLGQQIGKESTASGRKAMAMALERATPAVRQIYESGVFDPSKVGQQAANQNSMAALRFLEEAGEGWGDLPQHLEPFRQSFEEMKGLMDETLDVEQAAGLNTSELNDDFIRYFTRKVATAPGGPAKLQSLGQVFKTKHPFQRQRRELLTNLYGGTAWLQKLSTSELSGLMNDKARFAKWLRDNGLEMTEDISRGKFPPELKDKLLQKVEDTLGPDLRMNFADEGNMEDIAPQLARWAMNLPKEHFATNTPIFQINPAEAMIDRLRHGYTSVMGFNAMKDLIGEVAVRDPSIMLERRPRSVMQALKEANLDTPNAKAAVLKHLRKSRPDLGDAFRKWQPEDFPINKPPKNWNKSDWDKYNEWALDRVYIPEDTAKDVERYLKSFQLPDEVQALGEAIDKFTNMWRFGVTAPWPAFQMRNFVSGQFQNWLGDAFDPRYGRLDPRRYFRPLKDADDLMRGKQIAGDETGDFSKRVQELAFQHGVLDERHGQAAADLTSSRVAAGFPGLEPAAPSMAQSVRRGVSEAIPRTRAEANPFNIQGVRVEGAEDVFAPAKVARKASLYTEAMNRLSPFIAFIRQGMDPAEAARRVKKLQVDYTSLTPFERQVMRRAMPFYSFSSRVMPWFLEELSQRPGGKLGQTIRTIRTSQAPNPFTPEYISDTAAVPFGENREGTGRYLTGFGLMFEDPTSFASAPGLETLSRMNPILKGPLEMITGQTFFQRGPGGGRPLEDLDPPIGRTIANVREMLGGGETRNARPFISQGFEQLMSQLPTSRAVTTLRTLTDPRKGFGATAANVGTGVRITDVPAAARERRAQDLAEQLMRRLGARAFEKIYFPEDELEQMSPRQRELADALRALQKEFAQKAKERREKANR